MPEFQEKIFERFWQYREDENSVVEGMGLGLAISRSFIEKLGGRIWVESVLGKETTFYFTLPL
ncbi:MAG: ATP-binding protein [Bacteroidales bacterium]|nr:ATP-binding protein [Bacteroidales bacterium]